MDQIQKSQYPIDEGEKDEKMDKVRKWKSGTWWNSGRNMMELVNNCSRLY